jgi:hypothetical protein
MTPDGGEVVRQRVEVDLRPDPEVVHGSKIALAPARSTFVKVGAAHGVLTTTRIADIVAVASRCSVLRPRC